MGNCFTQGETEGERELASDKASRFSQINLPLAAIRRHKQREAPAGGSLDRGLGHNQAQGRRTRLPISDGVVSLTPCCELSCCGYVTAVGAAKRVKPRAKNINFDFMTVSTGDVENARTA